MRYLNPIEWIRWLGAFVSLWVLSIPWGRVSHSLPALMLLVGLTSLAVIAINEGSSWRDGLLDEQLKLAWHRDDYETAELIIRRQLINQPDDTVAIHNLARALYAQDRKDNATELMQQLAERKEHEPSARWLLSKLYLKREWTELDAEERKRFGALLALVHREAPSDNQIKNLYADYLIAAEKYASVLPILEELSRNQPMRGLQAAAVARSLGHDSEANRLAQRCLDEMSRISREEPSNVSLALSVAQNQLFLRRYAEASKTLMRSIRIAKSDDDRRRLGDAFGDSIVAWVQHMERSSSQTVQEKLRVLKLLQYAVQYAPRNPRVMAMVADHVLATAEAGDKRIADLRQALIAGSSPAISHFIQGTAALLTDDVEAATMHLKISADLMPNSGAILNNLAVAVAEKGPERLPEALKFANSAIDSTPQPPPHFYETRGQILLRMERHLDAVADLERALAHPALAFDAHRSLAKCYEKLGDRELSRQHREAAQALDNRG